MTEPLDIERIEAYTTLLFDGGDWRAVKWEGCTDESLVQPEMTFYQWRNVCRLVKYDVPLMLAEIKRLRAIEAAAKTWIRDSQGCLDSGRASSASVKLANFITGHRDLISN